MTPLFSTPLVLLALSCSDSKLSVFNAAPSALISYPADGSTLAEGDTIAMVGAVGDDGPVEELTAEWRLDGVATCTDVVPSSDGEVRCETTLAAGTVEITLVVEDAGGQAASDTVDVTVASNNAPSASISSPSEGAVLRVGELVVLEGEVADVEDGASGLSAWWTVDGATLEDTVTVDSDGGVTSSTVFAEQGQHTLALVVSDSSGLSSSDTVLVEVEAALGAPTCEIVLPENGAQFNVGSTVTLTAQVDDSDDAYSDLSISWSSDADGELGSSVAESDGQVAFSHALSEGPHVVTLRVEDPAEQACTDNVSLVMDSPPEIEILAPEGGQTFQEGEEVTVQVSITDAADDDSTLAVDWESSLDGPLGSGSPDSDGDLSFSLELSVGDHTVTVSASDSSALLATETLTLTVNGAPGAPSVSVSPASPDTSDALSAVIDTAAVDPEGGAITYSYGWTVDGADAGLSSALVPASATTKGELWQVSVVASDGDGGSSEAGSASVTIQDSAPTLTSISLAPTRPTVSDTLSVSAAGSDADGDTVSFTYAWDIGGSTSAETGSSLSTGFEKGDSVTVTVTPVADGVEGSSDSAAVEIVNSPPSAPTVSISPDEPYAGEDTLTCELDAFSSDADGDDISYAVDWTVDGVDAGVSSYTVDRDDTAPGDLWVCTVTPSDDEDEGTSASASVVVLGDPVDYAHTQYPCSITAAPGDEIDVYGWVYVVGVTDGGGEGAGIQGQVGYGAASDDPSDDDSLWTWFDGVYNADKDGLAPGDLANDEHVATLTAPAVSGTYAYAWRFSTDGGASWVYADLGDDCGGSGSVDGFDTADAGVLTVSD